MTHNEELERVARPLINDMSWINRPDYDQVIIQALTSYANSRIQERDEEWRKAIQNLINISGENASQDWYDGLRACKSITLAQNYISKEGN